MNFISHYSSHYAHSSHICESDSKKNILFIKQLSLVDICFSMPKNILIEQGVLDTNAEKQPS